MARDQTEGPEASTAAGADGATTRGGALLVACLEALGARQAFGVPGESYLAVLDALHDSPLTLTLSRHEGGAAFMACAWGQLTGEPGIAMVTRGPGATNAAIGVHTAQQGSVPMILFVGQVARSMRGREAFQELDYRAVFGPMAKWATEIDDPARIPEVLARAWRVATTGRPGPVVIALPEDMLVEETAAPPLTGPLAPTAEAAPGDLAPVKALLGGAARPLVIVGGGGWTAAGRAALRDWLSEAGIPALAAFRFHDLLDHHAPYFAGVAGVGMTPEVKTLIREADVILALNIRFGEMTTDGYTLFDAPAPRQAIIHSHADAAELGKIYQPALALHAGPNEMARALRGLRPGAGTEHLSAARAGFEASLRAPDQPGPLDMRAVIAHLEARLGPDAILTNGAGNFAVWTNRFFRFGPGQRLLAPQSGAMGYGIPAAIAAKIAHPEREVVCIAGDGDFQMTCAELGAAMQARACPVILVVNNGSYGTIRMHQERDYPGRVSGTALENPDFPALATAYGFLGLRVTETAEFAEALDAALAAPGGAVIELVLGIEALTPGATLSQIRGP
ncbi:MAG: thiamine pyrophosphate-dependent enzyme [Pseudomonadota bacterium]